MLFYVGGGPFGERILPISQLARFADAPVPDFAEEAIFRLRLRWDFCYTYRRGRLDCVFAVMRRVSGRVA